MALGKKSCYSYKNNNQKDKIEDYCFKIGVERDLTYILGARCTDGVVLIGDTKITTEGGTDHTYGKKILKQLNNIVIGASGIGGLFEEFQSRMLTVVRLTVQQYGDNSVYVTTEEGFLSLVTNVIREMHNIYGKDSYKIENNLQILCASRINPDAKLTLFYGSGNQETVKKNNAIGYGRYCASVFHKNMLYENMSMKETAKVGLFIIQCIQEMGLNESVGYDDKCLPQVVYIPDIKLPNNFPKNFPPTMLELEKNRWENVYTQCVQQCPIKDLESHEISDLMNEIKSKEEEFSAFIKELLKEKIKVET